MLVLDFTPGPELSTLALAAVGGFFPAIFLCHLV